MQSQTYSNFMLTLIAIGLVVIAFRGVGLFEDLNASEEYNSQMLPLNEDGSVNVRLTNLDEIEVDITGISTFDELDVKVVDMEGGPVKVKLEE